jgi:DNA (cytosine-5)-methyltransferase 1
MNHVDLFSGIGGFAYAAKQVWSSDYHNVCFCDNNPFCQQVIKKVFGKDSLIYGDIRTVTREQITADTMFGRYGEVEVQCNEQSQTRTPDRPLNNSRTTSNTPCLGRRCIPGRTRNEKTERNKSTDKQLNVDLLTGGFPCQPFSIAGNRKGKADNRFLWPEMLRIIKEIKPTWIIGENVAGILSMEQQQGKTDVESEVNCKGDSNTDSETDGLVWEIVNDIEQAGYFVQPFTIPACAVNAPHKRVRVWIVAYARCKYGTGSAHNGKTEGTAQQRYASSPQRPTGHGSNGVVTNARKRCGGARGIQRCGKNKGTTQGWAPVIIDKSDSNVTNPTSIRQQRQREYKRPLHSTTDKDKEANSTPSNHSEWNQNWFEVATSLCGVDDGLPVGLDGFKLTKAGHRVERLKALGNAIVPQVAMEIMRAIKESHL